MPGHELVRVDRGGIKSVLEQIVNGDETMYPPIIAPAGLILGALLGLAGTFVPSPSLRGLAWGIDGVALVTAGAVLLVHHFRQGHDLVASGFVVFTVGQALVLSTAAMPLEASTPPFAAGAALWLSR